MDTDDLRARLAQVSRRVAVLEAEAEIRRIQARYMFLCDTPCPEFGVVDDAERIDRIMALYATDAVWEGVGAYYDDASSAARSGHEPSGRISSASGERGAIRRWS